MLKRVLSMIIVLTMVLTAVVGCTDKNNQPQTPETNNEENQQTEVPEGDDTSSDYLVWNIGAESKTWDPTLNQAKDGGDIIQNLFEGLTVETKDGLEAAAAESWKISDDGLTYTFTLRDNLKWSDGEDLTAKDFEYAIKRGADSKTASVYSFLITEYIVGAEEFFNEEVSSDEVGVKALDDKTLEIKLKNPTPYFLGLTSFAVYMPVRADIVESVGEGWEKDPKTCISNGPFYLTEYKIGDHLTMAKNEHYWDAENVKLAGVKGLMIVEGTTVLSGYENGEIQVFEKPVIEAIPRLQKEDPNFTITPSISTAYVYFNVDNELFSNPLLRKAFSLAIDRKQFVEQVTKGGQIPATGLVPPGLTYSDGTQFRELNEDGIPAMEYDIDPTKALVEEAQKALAEAGYPNGEGLPELTYLYNTNENNKKIAEALQGMWKQNLGVDVKLVNQDWAVFQESRKKGDYVMARGSWIGDFNDPITMLSVFASNSGNNDAQWRYQLEAVAPHDTTVNPDQEPYQIAIDKSLINTGKERDAALKEAEDVLMQNYIIAPIFFDTLPNIVDESVVEGVELTAINMWWFKNAEIVR